MASKGSDHMKKDPPRSEPDPLKVKFYEIITALEIETESEKDRDSDWCTDGQTETDSRGMY